MTARVIALVEGPTEEKFVRELLAPAFWSLDVSIIPTTYGHPRRQGGVPAWGKAQRELLGLLKQDTGRHVTTMFDYYGMPLDWPGRAMAPEKPHEERGDLVEEQMRGRIAASLQSELAANRFIPYVQMHEFEALFFSDPESLGDVLARDARPQRIQRQLQCIADAFATPRADRRRSRDSTFEAHSCARAGLPEGHGRQHRGAAHRFASHETEMSALRQMGVQAGGVGEMTRSGERATRMRTGTTMAENGR